ncbi:hypothetical protein DPMN_145784 [Dreissena polymorpha]|uniref:Uncharacterized protein n=1 Tax=Dreissena polymorpha TaxID=45954 RepID=A0A9D4IZ62_DREPO|nr:hypothetical protein DPMN_145784 [Dreissena polymorpha]
MIVRRIIVLAVAKDSFCSEAVKDPKQTLKRTHLTVLKQRQSYILPSIFVQCKRIDGRCYESKKFAELNGAKQQ